MEERRAWESGKVVRTKEKGQGAFTTVQQRWFTIHSNTTTSKVAKVVGS